MNNKFPCKCGHKRSDHNMTTAYINGENFCKMCNLAEMFPSNRFSNCFHKYTPDNLKYLEQKALDK